MRGRYVYAIVGGRDRTPRAHGVGGRGLVAVRAGRLAAIAEPMERPLTPSVEHLEAQHRLIRRLANLHAAILPARFGSFAGDAAELRALLRRRARTLARALDRVRGTEQMILRLSMGRTKERPESGAAYLRSRAGLDVPSIAAIRRVLRPLGILRGERVEVHPARGAAQPIPTATVYHLIARGGSRRYYDAVREAVSCESGIAAVVTGPWPPYAFAPGEAG